MTLQQGGLMADNLTEKCRTDGETLPRETVQAVLKEEGQALAEEQFNCLRARVERRAKMISRKAVVDYTRPPRQALDATGRVVWYCDKLTLESAPKTGKDKVEVEGWFFDLDYDPTPTELAREYELRSLRPDFWWQCAVNEADQAFADERPNGVQWGLDKDGVASFATFNRYSDKRVVGVDRYGGQWGRLCRFGGVRK